MVQVVVPTPDVVERLAQLAAIAFEGRETDWPAEDFSAFAPPRGAVIADHALEAGLIVLQFAADEAEILNFGVVPAARRQGLGADLLEAAETLAEALGAARMFLEVAVDNAPARALYAQAGYTQVGERPGYYLRPDGSRMDALILAHDL